MSELGTPNLCESQHHLRIEEELNILLAQEGTKVILLRGAWGCGKTTLAKNLYLDSEGVLYISLYGLNNVDEIKSLLVLSWITASRKTLGESSNWYRPWTWPWLRNAWEWFDRRFPTVSEWSKSRIVRRYSKALPAGFHALLDASDFEMIIFDDLERPSANFDFPSFLGFLDYINERTNIKILLIGNDLEMMESQSGEPSKLAGSEKTIDHEVLLAPSPNWLADVAIKDSGFSEPGFNHEVQHH